MPESTLKTVPRGAPPTTRRDPGPAGQIDPQQALADHLTFTERDLYSVGAGKKQPSARLVREWARRAGLSAEVLEWGKNADQAWAKVRAWKGPKEAPEGEETAVVCHRYKDLLVASVFEAIANGLWIQTGHLGANGRPEMRKVWPKWEMGEDGWPTLTEPAVQFQLMKNYLERIRFSERDALTKAERIAFLKLLGQDEEAEAAEGEDDGGQGSGARGQETDPRPPTPDPHPKDLPTLRQDIYNGLLALCDGDRAKAEAELRRLSEVAGEYPAVSRLQDLKVLEHALEVASRVEALILQKQRAEKDKQNTQERQQAEEAREEEDFSQ